MWALVILLCVNDLPPDQCNEETAVQVTRPVEAYALPTACALAAMQILPMWEQADETTHALVRCVQDGVGR